ncbi:pentatricopeptide repeat-containing protein At3g14580, mitochondrial [Cryptomeria japonica]|uniref:pentatricopeptide repeat-containing protein At3g14580, mitochondrial n=1 Tax=Cryptomeria japonica TaxID=3369 RepID=UPI0027DA34F7|nr:pentatricopeptide repeat-containing protein At3g14580, mitochondrial [Cryptomeria japonica]XP_057865925.2 pentatricopeptide repeat-containing protein At3g14580, mitochondrial [Cryptomeria japonica]XP_057865926.2 pentatricopeptide repeat-containing protein At3g14580, mitochondrial [Cryptomeria japonica]XP_057865927.2 pentatricopeptide repeat-containing protein At3g14580, mitochondrial [Cryptomeria japonica]
MARERAGVLKGLIQMESLHCSQFHVWTSLKSACSTSTLYKLVENDDEELGIYAKKLKHRDWLTSNELLKILKPLNDPLLAIRIFNRAAQRPDYKPNETIYSVIFNKLACVGQFDIIEELLEQMKREDCRCTDSFFLELIKMFTRKAHNPDRALKLLFEMRDFKCWPTVKTFNFALNVFVGAKEFEKAYKLYLRAPEIAISPNTSSVNILIKALCRLSKIDAAYELLYEMPKQGCYPNEITYGILMNHLCTEGKVEEALKLFKSMTEYGCAPDTVIFNILISGLSNQGKITEAIELFESMQSKGLAPTKGSYHAILYGFLCNRKFIEAKAVSDQMLSNNYCPSFFSYKSLISGFCEEGLVDDAIRVLEQMVNQNIVPRMGIWDLLLKTILKNSCATNTVLLVKEIDPAVY